MFPKPQYVFLDDFLDDTGMVTPEYAVGILAAVTMAIGLVVVARSETVRQALSDMVIRALTTHS
jgi:hypothetical protein